MSRNCISNFVHCAKQGNESKNRHMKWREMTSFTSWIVNNFGWQSSFVQDFNRTPTHFLCALSIDSTYKGHLNSEWIHEVIVSSKMQT